MAPKGKRKAASSASPAKSPRPNKKINLNGSAPTSPSRTTRSRKAAKGQQSQEGTTDKFDLKDRNGTAGSSSSSRLGGLTSRLSLSSFSLPFLHHTKSSSSSSASVNGTASLNGVFSRLTNNIPPVRSLFSRTMRTSNGTSSDSKGKGKQRQLDEEEDHLSAEESARMIELLDTPVSLPLRSWPLRASEDDDANHSDGQSSKGVEELLSGDKHAEEQQDTQVEEADEQLETYDAATSPAHEVVEDAKEAGGAVKAGGEIDTKLLKGSADGSEPMIQQDSSPPEENGDLHSHSSDAPIFDETHEQEIDPKLAEEAMKNGVVVHEDRTYDEIFTPERNLAPAEGGDGSDEKPVVETPDTGKEEKDQEHIEEGHPPPQEEQGQDEGKDPTPDLETAAIEVDGEPARMKGSALKISPDDELNSDLQQATEAVIDGLPSEEVKPSDALTEEVTDQVGHLSVEEGAETSVMSYENEPIEEQADSDEDEEILIPSSQEMRGVIDLTDSTSPEPEAVTEQGPAKATPVRQKPSGFFANGLLAREKERQEEVGSYPAARVIHQLGSRQVSSPSVSSKVSHKSLSGFRKKDPIFSQARKFKARAIAYGKVDDMLTSLKRYVKKTMHTPFIDDMLKKRAALAKVLEDETPEDEIQIRHLREILRRSTYSLRPARRQLKEQERLAHEARLLRKRALGIFGRQPLPSSLSPDQDAFVTETLRKQGKVAQMPGAGVDARDIAKLNPATWLNDEVINFYMKLISKRSDEAVQKRASAKEAKKRLALADYKDEADRTKDIARVRDAKKIWNGICNVWTFNSFFWTKLTNEGYSGIRLYTKKVDIFTKDKVLLPINLGQMHWVCAAIDMRRCRFEYYDSMHSANPKVFSILRNYLESEYSDKKKGSAGPLDLCGWQNYFSRQSPSQANGYDCGIFSCMTLEQLSRRSPADGERDDLNVEAVVKKSRELAEERRKNMGRGGSLARSDSRSESDDDDGEDYTAGQGLSGSGEQEDEEEWNFSQANMPYLRRRMIYEIAKTKLLDE